MPSNSPIKVSVIIPCYNVEKYLRECLDSVVNQTLKEIEIICVNDGSKDGTLEILREYEKRDSRVIVIDQENQGVGRSRNNGINVARGEFVCFMDPDDWYPESDILEVLYKTAIRENVNICGGGAIQYVNGEYRTKFEGEFTNYTFEKDEKRRFSDYQYDYGFWRYIYKRRLLLDFEILFPPYIRQQDPPFLLNAMLKAKEFYALMRPTYCYRVSYKTPDWTNLNRVCDFVRGMTDCLKLSKENRWAKLHSILLTRIFRPYIIGIIKNALNSDETPRLLSLVRKMCGYVDLELARTHNPELPECSEKDLIERRPKVSVVVPVYNVSSYLRRCLDSLAAQTLKEIEIICVDDGSTDNSGKILEEYGAIDERIKVIHQENRGLPGARNSGIRVAKGDYIGFVDSDDYVAPEMFDKLYSVAEKSDSEVVECSVEVKRCGECDDNYFRGQKATFEFSPWRMDSPSSSLFLEGRFCTIVCNKIYKRDFLLAHGLMFDEKAKKGEDAVFTWSCMPHCSRYRRISEKLYFYQIGREGSIETQTGALSNWQAFLYTCESLCSYWRKTGLSERLGGILFRRIWNVAKWRHELCWGKNEEAFNERMPDVFKFFPDLFSASDFASLTAYVSPQDREWVQNWVVCKRKESLSRGVSISLTSFPARIKTVYLTIETLLSQTWKADRIVLWLADSQFPQKEGDLPEELLALRDRGLEIRWCEDLRSYKKLIPALKAFPEDIIVTVDDDLILEPSWLEKLVESYLKAPNYIHTHRAHEIAFGDGDCLAPYAKWRKEVKPEHASFNNFLTGGGGCLYPPNCLHEDISSVEKFQKLCPHGDDIWFWAMAVLAGTKICVTPSVFRLKHPDGTQEVGLWKTVNVHGENDRALRRVLEAYPQILPKLERIYIPKPADKNTGRETSSTLREKPCSSVVASTPECSKKLPQLLVRLGAMFIWNKEARKRWREEHMDLTPKNGIDIHLHPELRRDSALKRFAVRTVSLFIFSKSKRKAFRAKHLNLVPRDGIDVNLRGRVKSDSALKRFGVRVASLFIFSKSKRKAFRARHMDLTPKNGVDVNTLSPEERRLRKQKKRERNPLRRLFNAVVPASRSKVAHTENRIIRHMEWQTQQILSAIKGAQAQSERRFNELKQEIARAQKGLSTNIKTELDQVRERADVVSREQLARMDAQKKFFAERAEMLSRELDGLSSALTAGLSSQAAAVSNLASAQKALRASVIESYAALEKCKPNSLEFRTFGDLAHCIRTNLHKLPADADLVVGVPRSGMIPAYTIALFMNKRCCSLDEFLSDTEISTGARPVGAMSIRKVLVVDDSCFSGSALARTKERLKAVAGKYEFVFAAVYGRTESADKLDCCLELVDGRRVWQWNYLNHSLAGSACFDMDGVLCADPTPEENDDGAKYLNFIKNAKPLYIPSYKIRAIVTSRLEKYREPTETWLREHGVQYDELVMLNMATAEERRRANCHAAFKAEAYKARERTTLFVESEERQAKEIAFLSGKDVLCVATDKLY